MTARTGLDHPVMPAHLAESRQDFPVLTANPGLVYLDSAATALKPAVVTDAVQEYYRDYSANVHRSFHDLGEKATQAYEGARQTLARFIHAPDSSQLIFTSGTTAAINLAAWGYAAQVPQGDVILLTAMEHHSNLIPWQMLARQTGARLRFLAYDPQGDLILDDLETILEDRVRLVSLCSISNVLGTVNPVRDIITAAHRRGIPVLLDAAQVPAHQLLDVQALDCDLAAFSGHKMLGPTGVGVLYGKRSILEKMEPWQGGGDMISAVWLDHATWNDIPHRFEAGTPPIASAIGLARAADYLDRLGLDSIREYIEELTAYAASHLSDIEGLTLISQPRERVSVLSFVMEGVHPHDIAQFLNSRGVAIRAGHHCAQPVMRQLRIPAAARASLAFYNTPEDVDALAAALQECRRYFKV